jgi:LacI family transcriptional regulator
MALAHGVAIGTDVALASFDDISLFRLVRPTITAVVQPTARMASVAFELLMRRIGGQPADSVLLEASLAIRASTPGPTTTVTGS